MPTMETVTPDKFFIMLKGEPGTRKSTAALSWPTPQYWFSIDKKMKALITPMKNFGINPEEVHYDDFFSWDVDIRTGKPGINQKLEQLKMNCPYKTVILDSVTSMGDVVNLQTMNVKSGTTTKAGEEKGMRVGGIPVNTLEDYKAEASAFTQLISSLQMIQMFHGCSIILIAHVVGERQAKEVGVTHQARTIITGGKAISGKLAAYCEEIYHFNVESNIDISKEGEYGIVTRHTGDDFARTTLPLPSKITFNNDNLYEKYIRPAMNQLKERQAVTKL